MPTTVTSSIGTSSRDYSTLQAWEDASPANLVTDDKIWRGECYNDSEFTARVEFGVTADATRYLELTAATGQSFQDHASVRTNALRYNQSNGVAVTITNNYASTIGGNNCGRVSRLQIRNVGSNYVTLNLLVLKDCLCEGGGAVVRTSYTGVADMTCINVVAIANGSGGYGFQNSTTYGGTTHFIACTAVRPSNITAASTGFYNGGGGTNRLKSCASFGFSTAADAAGWSTANCFNNATDQASGLPGSSNQHSVTYSGTTPFTQADATGSLDFRAIAATSLAANGYLDSTNAPNDISGYARAASPTIGAWEITAGGGGSTFPWYAYAQQ